MLTAILALTLSTTPAWDCPGGCPGVCKCVETQRCFSGAPCTAALDGLDELNAWRAANGYPAFVRDEGLMTAAKAMADYRAAHLIFGHIPGGMGDFAFLPAGVTADATGCAAYPASYGWLSCCMRDSYRYAGAAWTLGADGKRYMHVVCRNSPAAAPVEVKAELVTDPYAVLLARVQGGERLVVQSGQPVGSIPAKYGTVDVIATIPGESPGYYTCFKAANGKAQMLPWKYTLIGQICHGPNVPCEQIYEWQPPTPPEPGPVGQVKAVKL